MDVAKGTDQGTTQPMTMGSSKMKAGTLGIMKKKGGDDMCQCLEVRE
jgi:hypothetical protein